MNARLLKSKMILYGSEDFVAEISKLLEISRQTASAKLNGEAEFTQSEIRRLADKYHLSSDEIKDIFFKEEIS